MSLSISGAAGPDWSSLWDSPYTSLSERMALLWLQYGYDPSNSASNSAEVNSLLGVQQLSDQVDSIAGKDPDQAQQEVMSANIPEQTRINLLTLVDQARKLKDSQELGQSEGFLGKDQIHRKSDQDKIAEGHDPDSVDNTTKETDILGYMQHMLSLMHGLNNGLTRPEMQ